MAANSIGDMTLSISKSDEPEAEIGTSRTTTEIVEIDAGIIRKGTSMSLLQATSKGKRSSVVTVEGLVKDISLSSTETITMNAQVPERLEFFIPKTILGNAKYTVPLQVLDKEGFPIKTLSDVEILLVPSLRNVISAPDTILLPKGQYYTTLLIEAKDDGATEITALANNFQSTKVNVQVTAPEPTVELETDIEIVKTDEEFIVTLDSKYLEIPLRDLNVKWSSNKAELLDATELTNELGSAEAIFVMNEPSEFLISAEISGPGYKTSTVQMNMQAELDVPIEKPIEQPIEKPIEQPIEPETNGLKDMLLRYPYLFILPAVGGVLFWLVKTERLNLPFDRLLEKLRKEED